MGRSRLQPIKQPDDVSCGPTSIKTVLQMLGKNKPLPELTTLCRTNRNGTSTKNMIAAINKIGLTVMVVENSTLKHVQGALKSSIGHLRGVIVSYLYRLDENRQPKQTSGHWAAISGFSASQSRIYLLDSYSGRKISYPWAEFRERWRDYDLKRKNGPGPNSTSFRYIKHWQRQLMLVIANSKADLPRFRMKTVRIYEPY